jgi:hypothetical protein
MSNTLRVVIYPRQLADLIKEHDGYANITPEAWAAWDHLQNEWRTRHRSDQVCIYVNKDGSVYNPNRIDLRGTPYERSRRAGHPGARPR